MRRRQDRTTGYFLDVAAAYNREGLPLPEQTGQGAANAEDVMMHPYYWAHLTESDTEDVLMELYVARRFRSQ